MSSTRLKTDELLKQTKKLLKLKPVMKKMKADMFYVYGLFGTTKDTGLAPSQRLYAQIAKRNPIVADVRVLKELIVNHDVDIPEVIDGVRVLPPHFANWCSGTVTAEELKEMRESGFGEPEAMHHIRVPLRLVDWFIKEGPMITEHELEQIMSYRMADVLAYQDFHPNLERVDHELEVSLQQLRKRQPLVEGRAMIKPIAMQLAAPEYALKAFDPITQEAYERALTAFSDLPHLTAEQIVHRTGQMVAPARKAVLTTVQLHKSAGQVAYLFADGHWRVVVPMPLNTEGDNSAVAVHTANFLVRDVAHNADNPKEKLIGRLQTTSVNGLPLTSYIPNLPDSTEVAICKLALGHAISGVIGPRSFTYYYEPESKYEVIIKELNQWEPPIKLYCPHGDYVIRGAWSGGSNSTIVFKLTCFKGEFSLMVTSDFCEIGARSKKEFIFQILWNFGIWKRLDMRVQIDALLLQSKGPRTAAKVFFMSDDDEILDKNLEELFGEIGPVEYGERAVTPGLGVDTVGFKRFGVGVLAIADPRENYRYTLEDDLSITRQLTDDELYQQSEFYKHMARKRRYVDFDELLAKPVIFNGKSLKELPPLRPPVESTFEEDCGAEEAVVGLWQYVCEKGKDQVAHEFELYCEVGVPLANFDDPTKVAFTLWHSLAGYVKCIQPEAALAMIINHPVDKMYYLEDSVYLQCLIASAVPVEYEFPKYFSRKRYTTPAYIFMRFSGLVTAPNRYISTSEHGLQIFNRVIGKTESTDYWRRYRWVEMGPESDMLDLTAHGDSKWINVGSMRIRIEPYTSEDNDPAKNLKYHSRVMTNPVGELSAIEMRDQMIADGEADVDLDMYDEEFDY